MSEERQVFHNTAVLALATLIDKAGSVFLILILSRSLHATGLGVYSATIAIYGLLSLVAEVGAPNFLVREIAKDKSKTGRYATHLGVIGIFGSLLAIMFAAVIISSLDYSPELRTCVYISLLAVTPGVLNALCEAIFVAHQRVELQTYTTLITALLSLAMNLYFLTHGYSVLSIVIVFVVTKYIVTFCYFFLIRHYLAPLWEQFESSFAFFLLHEIRAFAASSFLAGFFARPEILLLSLFTNETAIGFYTAALKLVELWLLLPETYMANVFPILSRSYHVADHKAQQIQERSIRYLVALSLPIAVGLTVAAEPIIHLFYGPDFTSSVTMLRILGCGLPFYFLNSVLWRTLVARGQQGLNVRAQMITLPSRLVLGGILIYTLGAFGAAAATISNVFLHNRLLSFYIRRDGFRLEILSLVWRFAPVSVLMGIVVFLLHDHLHLSVLVPFSALVYVVLLLLFRAFSSEELTVFRQAFRVNVAEKPS